MKKLLTILLAASVMTSPALARDGHGRGGEQHEGRYDRHDEERHERHEGRGHSDIGNDLAIGLGGFFLGSMLAQQNQRRNEEIIIIERNHRAPIIIERHDGPRYVVNGELYFYRGDWCQTITTQDSFGYVFEQHIECH